MTGEVRGSKLNTVLEGPYTQVGTAEIEDLFGDGKMFSFPKPSILIQHVLSCGDKDDLIVDFFAGSCSTAHAVMNLNAKDGGTRRHIMVQLPQDCEETSEAFTAGFKTIAEIAKERIRRAGAKIKRDVALTVPEIDTGFRVLKVDTSNMKDFFYTPDESKQGDLLKQIDNIREDRTREDLLFQVLVDWGRGSRLAHSKRDYRRQDRFLRGWKRACRVFRPGRDR